MPIAKAALAAQQNLFLKPLLNSQRNDTEAAMQILGHSSQSVNMDVYTGVLSQKQRDAVNSLPKIGEPRAEHSANMISENNDLCNSLSNKHARQDSNL